MYSALDLVDKSWFPGCYPLLLPDNALIYSTHTQLLSYIAVVYPSSITFAREYLKRPFLVAMKSYFSE